MTNAPNIMVFSDTSIVTVIGSGVSTFTPKLVGIILSRLYFKNGEPFLELP